MPQFNFGPIYCETMSATSAAFPVEPVNTISNGVIVLFGLLSLYVTVKRSPRAIDLYILSMLLIVTGIGSGIWHGFRDRDALFFEVQSGLFFLFAFAFFWARRLWSFPGAFVFFTLFFAGFLASRQYWDSAIFGFPVQRWVALAPVVILAGIALTVQTYAMSRRAAVYGGSALALAIVALVFRTVDLSVCSAIPVGTHFLWHSFLSAAGFIGVLTLIAVPARRIRTAIAPAAAE
ncbi:MAG TPA: hypothetical protein VNH44_10290 [Micropepsaceae bacterium]|nr:hypothetical protein [Micropepsaceae bacterium]